MWRPTNWPTTLYVEEDVRLELTIPSSGITAFQERLLILPDAFLIAAPEGVEPPNSAFKVR